MTSETLRYATLSLTGVGDTPLRERFHHSSAVRIESIRYLSPVEDGQYVGLSELVGDLDVAREFLTASDEVVHFDTAGAGGHGIVYACYQNVGPIGELLEILYQNDIVLDWPIEFLETEDSPKMRFTVVGTETGIQQAKNELPEGISLTIKRIGHVERRTESTSLLTDKQAALLALAIEEGYYDVPRETTQRALAERIGVAPGTIGDRLQRIERRVMIDYAEESGLTPPHNSSVEYT